MNYYNENKKSKISFYSFSVFLFVFLLSFTSGFALGEYLRLYVIASFIFIFLTFFKILTLRSLPRVLSNTELPIIIFIIYIALMSLFVNSDSTLNYLIVYIFFFIFVYFCFKFALKLLGPEKLLKFNFIAVSFVSLFIVIELFLHYFFQLDIHSYIPRFGPTPVAIFLNDFKRPYAFSTEPTNLASYLLPFGGLAIYYLFVKKINFRYLISFFIFFSFILTFSAAGFAAMLLGIIIAYTFWIFNFFINSKVNLKIFFYLLILILFLMFVKYNFNNVYEYIFTKITLSDEGFRSVYWKDAITLIIDNSFLPHGLGSNIDLPIINTYLLITYECGLIGLLLFGSFFIQGLIIIVLSKIPLEKKVFFIFLLTSSAIQMNGFSTFYYPYALLLVPFIMEIIRTNFFQDNK